MSDPFASGVIVAGPDGPVAHVRNVALSPVSLEATWLVVDVLDSSHVTAVPTSSASVDSHGAVRVPFGRDQLLTAPAVTGTVDGELGGRLRRALGLA